MAGKKTINFPERNEIITDEGQLKLSDKQFDSLNFEVGVPLKEGVPYLLLPQRNCGQKFVINKRENISKRFWLTELSGDEVEEFRTVGVQTLKALYIEDSASVKDAPEFPSRDYPNCKLIKNDAGYLRVQGVQYKRALEDTSFIKGEESTKRAIVTKPVIIKVKKRGGAWILSYKDIDQKLPDGSTRTVAGGDVKTVGKGENAKAVCSENTRFYFFENGPEPTAAQIANAHEALSAQKGTYLLPLPKK